MAGSSPPLRPYARGPVRAQTASEAADFDAWAIEEIGVPQPVLMENAGRSAAQVARELFSGSGVVALVGSGNNGGDALVAARSLRAWGCEVTVVLAADRDARDPLLHGWDLPVVVAHDLDRGELARRLAAADFVVDGILGTGVRGAPRERQGGVIEALNQSGAAVLSLDVPSGIDASTGAVPGVAVKSTVTVSFGAPKLGTLLHPARGLVGRHVTVEIGFPRMMQEHAAARLATPEWAAARLPVRSTDTHKNRVGRVLVVGGAPGMAGAVVLAGRAAFRAGAGLVQVASAPDNRDAVHPGLPEAIFVDWKDGGSFTTALKAADAVAAGPGLGKDEVARAVLRQVVETGDAPLVLDADALNLAAEDVVDLTEVASRRPLLITPHPGEMARLLPGGEDDEEPPRTRVVRSASDRFGCAVLLKGAPSLVTAPGESLVVDTQGSSDLAVAGMGDALTGVCASFMAQGLNPGIAASVGLYATGRASRLAGRGAGLVPSDVAERLPDALREGGEASTDLDLPFVVFDSDPAD